MKRLLIKFFAWIGELKFYISLAVVYLVNLTIGTLFFERLNPFLITATVLAVLFVFVHGFVTMNMGEIIHEENKIMRKKRKKNVKKNNGI